MTIISRIAKWLEQYMIFPQDFQSTVLATWICMTHVHDVFSAIPYVTINARTKRAGKTRLGVELLQYIASVGKAQTAPTFASMMRDITELHATMIFDESESMSSEAKNGMHAMMNAGYKKGQVITRSAGKKGVIDYQVFGPKLFILIGDPSDTLRDRSIIVTLERSLTNPQREYIYEEVTEEAGQIREQIHNVVEDERINIFEAYKIERAKYLVSDREEEIWRSLLAIGKVLGSKEEYEVIKRAAVDLATMKTAPKIHIDLDHEKLMDQVEYSRRLISDCVAIHQSLKKNDIRLKGIKNTELLAALLDLDLSPWRKYNGVGLDLDTMTELLKAGGTLIGTQNQSQTVITVPIRRGTTNKGSKQEVIRGYKWQQILAAANQK